MMNRISAAALILATAIAICTSSRASAAVTAENLLLVVNKQQPAGRQIAERYATLRQVPADRIVEVDVPDRDDVPAEVYDASIARVIREQVVARGLRPQVTCIVTFYGVPLRVKDRAITPAERIEAADIVTPMIEPLRTQLRQAVESIEAIARDVDPSFKPLGLAMDVSEQIRARGAHAERSIATAMKGETSTTRQTAIAQRLIAAQRNLTTMPALKHLPAMQATSRPTDPQIAAWTRQPESPEARRELRTAIHAQGNVFGLLALLEGQRAYLTAGEGEAALDSELACVFLESRYPRAKWIPNPFHHGSRMTQLQAAMVRTARIDGPTPDVARRIVEDAVAVEAIGLKGDAVLDGRGLADANGVFGSYDAYDKSIRNATKLFANASELPLIADDAEPLLPDRTSANAAIYCGWYQLRRYSPTVRVSRGGVAFHVASLEMMSLHSPGEAGWCRGLLNDGAAVTLGAVGEPYLFAFPPADEFFGLLMTGKPTLVEAYWATVPVASWRLALIGDPLYRPFAKNPVISTSALPEALRAIAK